MIGKKIKNPLVCAALLCAVLVYSGAVKVKDRCQFVSLVEKQDIVLMSGKIASNPVKLSSRPSYSCAFEAHAVVSKSGVTSSCSGRTTVFIDEAIVEAHFPGKLYSSSKGKGALMCETGARAVLSGSFKGDIFFVKSVQGAGWENGVRGRIAHVRARSRLQFRRLMYAWGAAGGLLLALLSGSREYTERVVSDAFKGAGLSHILALSGMHLSLVSGIALFAGTHALGKKRAYLVQFFAVVLFVWFAGFSPSLMRAFLCSALLLLFALCSVRGVDMFVVLCISFLCHAFIAPSHLLNAAFMLSYGALAGILLLAEKITVLLVRAVPQPLASSLAASTGAQVFTAPVSLALFGTFMPAGIIATVAVSPLVTLFIYGGLACMVLCLACPFFVGAAGFAMNALYGAIKLLAVFFAQFPAVHL